MQQVDERELRDTARPVHVRWLIRRDLAEVLEIERECFADPWSEAEFVRVLRQHTCIGMVAEHGEQIVGYMLYELQKSRLHLLNFAVATDCRRQRVGTQMVSKLIRKLTPSRRNQITLEVRETNLPAQLFFRSQGFFAEGIARGWYEIPGGTTEDAYRMRYAVDHRSVGS